MSSSQQRQVVYSQPGGIPLTLDIYTPDLAKNCETAVLLLHGGGWRHGDKALMAPYAELLSRHGFTPIAVQYRLLPDHPWPAQRDDVLAAIEWVHSHARDLGVRPDGIVLEGFSAGAHLSLMAAAKATGVGAVVAFFPATRLAPEPSGPHEINAAMLLGPDASEAAAWEASPLAHVHGKFPPTFLLHGNGDWLVGAGSSLAIYEALIAAGAAAELHIFAGAHHEFCSVSTVISSVQDEVAAFIKRVVVEPKAHLDAADRENPFAAGPEAFAARIEAMHS